MPAVPLEATPPAWMQLPRHIKRLTVAFAMAVALACGGLIDASSADLSTQIQASKTTAANLQSQINSESAAIARTAGGIAAAQQRLNGIQAQLEAHITQLRSVQNRLLDARDRLVTLENKLYLASKYLAANLRSQYEGGSPNLVDVILNAHGFSNLLNQVNDIKDAQQRDTEIVSITRIARKRVEHEALGLGSLERADQSLTNQILQQRNQAAVIAGALVQQEQAEESERAHEKTRLANVNEQTAELQKKYDQMVAAAEAQARLNQAQQSEQVNQQAGGVAIDSADIVQAPAGAPAAVVEMINAGNLIATLPYIWGGGHGSFQADGYDCSGSVSFVLHAAGLLTSPEVSGDFESYGDPGAGQWVTIYANSIHVWMEIAGWRFDTVALAEDGTRWAQGGGEFAGFVVRHPVGL